MMTFLRLWILQRNGWNKTLTPIRLTSVQHPSELAKAMLDFHYGVVMANKPQYTASRKERIEQINEMFPQ